MEDLKRSWKKRWKVMEFEELKRERTLARYSEENRSSEILVLSFVWRRHVGVHPDGHQHGDRKPTETSVNEFCDKSVNSSLEELININEGLFIYFKNYCDRKKIDLVVYHEILCDISVMQMVVFSDTVVGHP